MTTPEADSDWCLTWHHGKSGSVGGPSSGSSTCTWKRNKVFCLTRKIVISRSNLKFVFRLTSKKVICLLCLTCRKIEFEVWVTLKNTVRIQTLVIQTQTIECSFYRCSIIVQWLNAIWIAGHSLLFRRPIMIHYSNSIQIIMTTYIDPYTAVTMTVMEMCASMTVLCHYHQNMRMALTAGNIKKMSPS